MAIVTGSYETYTEVANREDLTDMIYMISPTETPFMSMIGREKATNTLHEWQTDSLNTASTSNAAVEGELSVVATSNPTSRIGNYCQISNKTYAVSGTQQAMNTAGKKSVARLVMNRGLELRRDMESIVTQNQGYNAGATNTARKLRSLESWLSTNESRGSGGAAATAATAAATDGTQRAFTEALVKDVLLQTWDSGGKPSVLMMGGFNKQEASDFTGRASARQNIGATDIQAAAILYAGDFGNLKMVPNRFQRARTAFALDPDYWAMSFLRPFATKKLADVGDSDQWLLNCEYTLVARNEASSGVIADLTTS